MSKAIRIREHLYDEIERLAKQERRSMIGQLEYLLEQALRLPDKYVPPVVQVTPELKKQIDAVPDPHFKPDFKK